LIRDFNGFGEWYKIRWYKITDKLEDALGNIRYCHDNGIEFEDKFVGEDTYAIITEGMDFEFDGYKGTLTKQTKLYTSDFEKVPVRVGD